MYYKYYEIHISCNAFIAFSALNSICLLCILWTLQNYKIRNFLELCMRDNISSCTHNLIRLVIQFKSRPLKISISQGGIYKPTN